MFAWQATVQDEQGVVVVNPSVTVYLKDGVTLAQIFNEDGTVKLNPFIGSLEGFVKFFSYSGEFKVKAESGGTYTETWDIYLGDISYVSAEEFGFSPSNTGEQNKQFLESCLVYANGREVKITSDADFLCNSISIPNINVNLNHVGKGSFDKTSGGGVIQSAGFQFQGVQSVSSIDRVSVTIDGSPSTVTRLSVASSIGYGRGAIVKICSDDINPDADDSGTRRLGETAVVAGVSDGYIYLAGVLEDQYRYITNVRVGYMPEHSFSIRGLKIKSSNSNTSALMNISGVVNANIEYSVDTHGQIALNLQSGVTCIVSASGDGKGDSSGSLGYLVNDISGTSNKINVKGSFWRHLTTTNINISTPSDDLRRYGATRDHHVINGIALGSQGTPFDDHPGAIRSIWENCVCKGALRNSASAQAAFQCRGMDSLVVNPTVDSSYSALLRLSTLTRGVVTVRGGISQCPIYESTSNTTGASDIFLYDHDSIANSRQIVFSDIGPSRVHISGGSYGSTQQTQNSAQIISGTVSTMFILDDPMFFVSGGTATGFRYIRLNGSGKVVGSIKAYRTSGFEVSHILRSEGTLCEAVLKVKWLSGPRPSPITGTWARGQYSIVDMQNSANSICNSSNFDEFKVGLGAI